MRVRTWWMAGLVLLGTAAGGSGAPREPACSTGRVFGVRSSLFVLATAGADTVRAGPGPIRYNAGADDPASLATIHGQRFRLDRVGGDVPAELAGAAGGEAVLVPYGWECRETWRWREARWATPGAQVFVDAALRPREQWVDGRPTFDVEVVHDVYPENYVQRYLDSAVAMLTPAEVFEMNAALPTWEQVEADTASAYGGFLAWARANPALIDRFPAHHAMRDAQESLQPCVPVADPHPVAGTYRASVILEGRDTLSYWFRTDARGYPMCGPVEPRLDLAEVRPRMADTARLHLRGSRDAAGVESAAPSADCGGGTVLVVNRPRETAGAWSWEADYNYIALPPCFASDPRVRVVADSLFAAFQAGERGDTPGRFTAAGEDVRFEQAWRARGRVLLELRATRVGTAEPAPR